MEVDICIPTLNSEKVIEGALSSVRRAETDCDVTVGTLRIVDSKSTDRTVSIAESLAEKYGWSLDLQIHDLNLPGAREELISRVETEWFLFLDDDVRLPANYFDVMHDCIAPKIGGIQGRNASKLKNDSDVRGISDIPASPTDWVRKRAFRGGTHATFIRTIAARSVEFPPDLVVWEDEYLRRQVESQGYLWIFNHQAIFEHEIQERHKPGWNSGYLQAKYRLRPFWHVVLNLPYALLTGKSPIGYIMMIFGYIQGSNNR